MRYLQNKIAIVPLLLWALGVQAEVLSFGVRGHMVKQEIFSLFAAPGEEIRWILRPMIPGSCACSWMGRFLVNLGLTAGH